MRTKIFIALLAIAIGMSACDWFKTSSPNAAAFDIKGYWKLDSAKPGKDSTANAMWLAEAILAEAKANDSAVLSYEFRSDTLYSNFVNQLFDTAHYSFNSSSGQLTVFDGTVPKAFTVVVVNDSSISVTSSDSAVMYLRKQ